jgi:hypothetical protein
LDGKVSREGITKDLENLARLGASRILLYDNIYRAEQGDPVTLKTPERNELTRFSLREAKRLGLDVHIFNSPGWSQSGGPWIRPEQSMRRVTWKVFETDGGAFSQDVRPVDEYPVQDIAVLAVPRIDGVTIEKPYAAGKIEFAHSSPFVARSLSFVPKEDNYHLHATLFAVMPDGKEVAVRAINERVYGRNAYVTQWLKRGQNHLKIQVTSTNPCKSPGMMGPVRLISSERSKFVFSWQLPSPDGGPHQ